MSSKKYYFRVADHPLCISFEDESQNGMHLLPSFKTFESDPCTTHECFFTLTVDDHIKPEEEKTLIRTFDTGNGDTIVYRLPDGGYQYIIKDIYGRECCLLICDSAFSDCRCALNGDWTMRSFGLNDALMLIYAFAGASRATLLIHASCVINDGKAYPFIANSGTGKSTHSSLWMKHIEDTELLNDDNPIIRIIDGKPFVYGSPWSGKTPCYRDVKAPLGAVVRIERAPHNYIERQAVVQAFASLLPACSSMKWDEHLYDHLCNTITQIIATTPILTMHCLPDEEAALVCHKALHEL